MLSITTWTPAIAQTPTFGWARSLGRIYSIVEVAEAPDGRMVVMGMFTGTRDLDLGPGVMEIVGGGGNSTFIATTQADGTLEWAVALTSTSGINGSNVAVAPDGSIILTGSFRGTADLDASPTSETPVTSSNGNSDWDVFMTKYSSDGDFVWGFSQGSAYDDLATRIAVDGSGNIFHCQRARGSFDMDPGPATVTFEAGTNATGVMSKYAADGTFQWYQVIGPNANTMRVLANGNIIIGFPFGGQRTIGTAPNTITLGDETVSSAYGIVRLNAQGVPQQGVYVPGIQSVFAAIGADGAVTMAGAITDESDLDPGPGTNIHTPNGVYDPFALRVNAEMEGDWGVSWGDDSSDDIESMDIDGYGNVYIVAKLYGPYDVDPGPDEYLLDNVSSTNCYLLMLNAGDGTMGFATRLMESETGFLNAYGIRLAADGTIITYGAFRATAPVDPWTDSFSLTVQTVQTEEIYICAFDQAIGLGTQEAPGTTVPTLFPVPCTDRLTVTGHEQALPYRMIDMTGRAMLEGRLSTGPSTLDVSLLPPGVYLLQLHDAQQATVHPFMKQ